MSLDRLDHPAAREDEPIVYKRSVARFPYLVLFYLRDGEPVIIAYAHEGREPG